MLNNQLIRVPVDDSNLRSTGLGVEMIWCKIWKRRIDSFPDVIVKTVFVCGMEKVARVTQEA
jgi:hypothetical protein